MSAITNSPKRTNAAGLSEAWNETSIVAEIHLGCINDHYRLLLEFLKNIQLRFSYVNWSHCRVYTSPAQLDKGIPLTFCENAQFKKFIPRSLPSGFCSFSLFAIPEVKVDSLPVWENIIAYTDISIHNIGLKYPSNSIELMLPDFRNPCCSVEPYEFRNAIVALINTIDCINHIMSCIVYPYPRSMLNKSKKYGPDPYEEFIKELYSRKRNKGFQFDPNVVVRVGWALTMTQSMIAKLRKAWFVEKLHEVPNDGRRIFADGLVVPLSGGDVLICLTESPLDAVPGSDGYDKYMENFCDLCIEIYEAGLFPF